MVSFSTIYKKILDFIPISIHWLFWGTMALMLGIVWYCNKISPITTGTLGLMVWFVLVCLLWRNSISVKHLQLYSFIGISFFVGAMRYHHLSENYYRFNHQLADKIIDCRAKVLAYEQVYGNRFKWCLTIKLQSLEIDRIPAAMFAGSVLKFYTMQDAKLEVDDIIQLKTITIKKCMTERSNFYSLKEGITCTLFLPHLNCSLIYKPKYSLFRFIDTVSKRIAESLRKKLTGATRTLFFSLFLGSRCSQNKHFDYIKESCTYWGIAHYLARSGLHVVLIVLMLSLFLGCIPCHFILKQIFLLIVISMYYLLTWSSISFIRAFVTFFLYKACVLNYRAASAIHILTITCFLLLIYNPFHLLALDFQLSFLLAFALAWFSELKLKKSELQNY